MKSREIAFLILIFTCSLSVYAKDSNKEMPAPKNTWKIVVKNNLSADKNDALMDSILSKKNYYIQSKDAQLNSIRASNKNNFKKKIVTYLLTITIKDNAISVTGKYSTNISVGPNYDQKTEASFKKISNRGVKRGISQETFANMQSFALLLGSNLEYITK